MMLCAVRSLPVLTVALKPVPSHVPTGSATVAMSLQVVDPSAVTRIMEQHQERWNAENPASSLDLTLYPEAVNQVLHLVRGLQQPGGHVLLLGQSTNVKRSLACFATSLLGLDCPPVALRKAACLQDFRKHLKVKICCSHL